MPSPAALRDRPRAIRPLIAALATIGLILSLITVGAPAFADDVDGISGSPASETGRDGRTRFDYQAAPGQHLTDAYEVKNAGTTPQKLTVFATDAYNDDNGAYALLDTSETPTDAGTWVTFDGKPRLTLDLKPGASKVVSFAIEVPDDATPGDHAAGIVISSLSKEGTVLIDRRVATRLYVRVPGDLQPLLSVSSISANYHQLLNPFDGTVDVTVTLQNSGNVALGADMAFGINTYFGIGAAAVVTQKLPQLLPGATRTMTVTVPGVAQLGYLNPYVKLVPTVDPGALEAGPFTEITRDTFVIAWPWWLLALLVVGLIIAGILWLRRRRDEKHAAEWVAFTEEEARRKAADEREPVGAGAPDGPRSP